MPFHGLSSNIRQLFTIENRFTQNIYSFHSVPLNETSANRSFSTLHWNVCVDALKPRWEERGDHCRPSGGFLSAWHSGLVRLCGVCMVSGRSHGKSSVWTSKRWFSCGRQRKRHHSWLRQSTVVIEPWTDFREERVFWLPDHPTEKEQFSRLHTRLSVERVGTGPLRHCFLSTHRNISTVQESPSESGFTPPDVKVPSESFSLSFWFSLNFQRTLKFPSRTLYPFLPSYREGVPGKDPPRPGLYVVSCLTPFLWGCLCLVFPNTSDVDGSGEEETSGWNIRIGRVGVRGGWEKYKGLGRDLFLYEIRLITFPLPPSPVTTSSGRRTDLVYRRRPKTPVWWTRGWVGGPGGKDEYTGSFV